jgi:hypothetical protein
MNNLKEEILKMINESDIEFFQIAYTEEKNITIQVELSSPITMKCEV